LRFPEDTSTGAVPLQAAKRSRLANRDTSATSPITVAAANGPTPKRSVRLVPDARTAAASFFSGLAHLLIQAPHVRQEVGGKAGASLPGDARRRDTL
jgi:hypothetical protein